MTNFTQARVLCWLIFFWSSMYEYFLNDSTNHSNKSCPSLVCFMHIRNGSLAQSATPHHRTLVNVIVCVLRQLHQLFCTRAARTHAHARCCRCPGRPLPRSKREERREKRGFLFPSCRLLRCVRLCVPLLLLLCCCCSKLLLLQAAAVQSRCFRACDEKGMPISFLGLEKMNAEMQIF